MPALTSQSTLADRWIAEASADAATDHRILNLIDAHRTGEAINERALLKALIEHAEAIVVAGADAPDTGAEQPADVGGIA